MAQIKISALTTGSPQGTDLIPAVDTTDTTQAASGTTKKYIRSSVFNWFLEALGYDALTAVRVASTVALTVVYANGALGVGATLTNAGAMAALSLDGVAVAVADRVLIWNQAAPAQNGIYTVTAVGSGVANWVLTRATDYDQAAEIANGQVVLVNQGTLYASKLFQQVGVGPWTMGTTAIVFELFNPAQANFNWITVTAASQAMQGNNGYIANNAGVVTLALPTTSVVGDEIAVAGQGAGGWLISQAAGQQIHVGPTASSLGALGSVASSNQYDTVRLVCIVANTIWTVIASQTAVFTIA